MSHVLDASIVKDMPYLVDSANPPMAYGSVLSESLPEAMDESKGPTARKSKQPVVLDQGGPWNSANFVARSALPMSSPDQPQRVAFADIFRHSKRNRATVSSKVPPPVLAFSFAESASLNYLTVNLDATMVAACYDSCTVISNLHVPPSDTSTPSKLYNSIFQPIETHVTLPSGHSTLCASFAPDSPVVLTATSRGQVSLWSIEGAKRLVSYTGHTSHTPVWDVAWAPCALYFGTGSGDAVARIWRSDIPFPIRLLTLPNDQHARIIRWHPSCQLVGVAGLNSVAVFEISGPKILFSFPLAGTLAIEFSPTGLFLAIATSTELSVWELKDGTRIFHQDCFVPIRSLAWGGDGILLSIEETGKIRLWDRLFISKPSVLELSNGSLNPMHMHFTPRNLLVVAGTEV